LFIYWQGAIHEGSSGSEEEEEIEESLRTPLDTTASASLSLYPSKSKKSKKKKKRSPTKKEQVSALPIPLSLCVLSLSFSLSLCMSSVSLTTHQQQMHPKRKKHHNSSVVVCDLSCLLPISKDLAADYRYLSIPLLLQSPLRVSQSVRSVHGSILDVCKWNEAVAIAAHRRDLAKVWALISLIADPRLHQESVDPSINPFDTPWALHPFGRNLVTSLYLSLSHCVCVSPIAAGPKRQRDR
jgi:hypothetical protein